MTTPTYFVLAETHSAHVTVARNGVANNSTNSRFVQMATGSDMGESEVWAILDNATEQFETGSKLVEVVRYGTTELNGLIIRGNQFGSPLATAPATANGQPCLDLNYIKGYLVIDDNRFPNSATTAIKLDNFRLEDGTGVGAVGRIVGNSFNQLGIGNGKLFTLSTIAGTTSTLTIGRNGHANFYTGDMGGITYPTNVRFDTAMTPVSNLTATGTLTISPWDNFVEISGTTIINNINPTWVGHELTLLFLTESGGCNDAGNLQLNSSFRARTPNESLLRLRCDGVNWQEVSRVTEQLLAAIVLPNTADQTLTVPGYASLVQLTGGGASATVATLTVNRNGQRLTLVGGTGLQVTFRDGAGNMLLASDCLLGDNDTLSMVPNNDTWFETSRSTN
jgi:hypothetical protein